MPSFDTHSMPLGTSSKYSKNLLMIESGGRGAGAGRGAGRGAGAGAEADDDGVQDLSIPKRVSVKQTEIDSGELQKKNQTNKKEEQQCEWMSIGKRFSFLCDVSFCFISWILSILSLFGH